MTSFEDSYGEIPTIEKPDISEINKSVKMADHAHPYITFQSWAANQNIAPTTAKDNQRVNIKERSQSTHVGEVGSGMQNYGSLSGSKFKNMY